MHQRRLFKLPKRSSDHIEDTVSLLEVSVDVVFHRLIMDPRHHMNILLMNTNHLLHGVITALLLVAKLLRMLAGRTHHQIRLKNKDRRLTVEVALLMDLVLFKQIYQEPIEEEVYWVAANKK
jgi:hypothetical protein